MKNSIKILILVLVSLGLISGILVFAKTRVAPPKEIECINQFSKKLQIDFLSFGSINDFSECCKSYVKLEDMLNLYYNENSIDSKTADEYRKKIDDKYGKCLISYSFDILRKSVWPEDQVNGALTMISNLREDKLLSGERAVTEEFIASADKFNSIINDYRTALRLSRSTSFNGISDATSKISKARTYSSQEYLKNNAALVSGLNSLPSRIAQSHYNYVSSLINSLSGYQSVTKDYYMNTLIPKVDNAINEYKATKIYGSSKPSIKDLENRAVSYVTVAMNYYGY